MPRSKPGSRSTAGQRACLAFPNAYVSTDEPPRRSLVRTALCALALAGVAYLGIVILVLSLTWSAYSPISQVASDYGVGAYASWMNSGFFLAGAGVIALAAVGVSSGTGRGVRRGSALLLLAGAALIVSAFFQTDIEGAATTFRGTVHSLAGIVFFITAPVALLLISHGYGRKRFVPTLGALLAAVSLLAAIGALGLDAGGLGERVVILVVFSALLLTSATFLKEA